MLYIKQDISGTEPARERARASLVFCGMISSSSPTRCPEIKPPNELRQRTDVSNQLVSHTAGSVILGLHKWHWSDRPAKGTFAKQGACPYLTRNSDL